MTHLFKRLIYEIQNNLHQLTTHMLTLIMWHNRFSENENEAVKTHTTASGFQDEKTTTSRLQDQKNATSRFGD